MQTQKLTLKLTLGSNKSRTLVFVRRWLGFFPDCVDRVRLTGCSLGRYSNTFRFPLPPATFPHRLWWLLRSGPSSSGAVIYSSIQACFTPSVPARCGRWGLLFWRGVTPRLPPPQRGTRPTQKRRHAHRETIYLFTLFVYSFCNHL